MRSFILFNSLTYLVLAGLLTACGGGGGGSAPPAADTPTPTVLASAYVGTASSPGFWAVVQSTQSGGEFLAMNYNGIASSSVSTMLYSGKVQAGVNGAVTVSGLRTMRAKAIDPVRDGTASISGASLTGFVASFDANTNEAANHQATAVLPVDAVAGDWTGRWVDNVDSNVSLSLRGLAGGGTVFIDVPNCSRVSLSLGAWQAASRLYPVQLDYPDSQTGCGRQNTQLKGWAFVQLKETKQILRFMAVDTSGSGISFSAER
jgi:hypothetical protein